MMRRLKLIWDFKGPDSLKTAQHHEIHLKEYITIKNLSLNITGVQVINEFHTIAFMVVNENEMVPVRNALKPHRGQVYI